jgi:hypothetical protein
VELGEVARRPVLRARIIPARVGRFIRDLHHLLKFCGAYPASTAQSTGLTISCWRWRRSERRIISFPEISAAY